MYPDQALKEKVIHGTPGNPIQALHFTAGDGTPFPDHFFVERHWHKDVEIHLIRKGSYLFEINLENDVLREGDICILNSEDLHQITGHDKDAVHDVVLFDPQILNFSYMDEWEKEYIAPFVSQALIFRNILHPFDAGYSETEHLLRRVIDEAMQASPGWYVKCKLLLLELFDLLTRYHMLLPAREVVSRTDARKIERYKAIISFMEDHYGEPISLQQLADTIPCNSQYLCRFFREIAGMSPIQYLITYRLEQACTLLSCTTRPVTEIAMDCGFDNISYFIRKFKAVKGCTPKEYREKHMKGTENHL